MSVTNKLGAKTNMKDADFGVACVILLVAYCEHVYREEYKHYSRFDIKTISRNRIPSFIIFLLPFKYRQHRKNFSLFFFLFIIFHYSLFLLLGIFSIFNGLHSTCWSIYVIDMIISWILLAYVERANSN